MKITHLSLRSKPAELLQSTGLALEYFPAFEHNGIDDLPIHGHDFLEMNYIIKGRCQNITKDFVYEAKFGSLIIVNYDQEHNILTPHGPVEKMNIYLDFHRFTLPSLPPDLQKLLVFILPMHLTLAHKLNRVVHLHFTRSKLITHILKTMYKELENREIGYQESVDYYFRLFLIECCRTVLQDESHPSPHQNINGYELIEKVRQHIDRNFTRPLTLGFLAEEVMGGSSNYLCRLFKEYTGKSVVKYIHHRRIEMAMMLLRSSKDKIIQICLKSGFNDISYFNHKFKEIVGMTPHSYRDQF